MLFVVLEGLGFGVLFIIYWLIGMKDGIGKRSPNKTQQKTRKKEMSHKLKILPTGKNYGAIRQAV